MGRGPGIVGLQHAGLYHGHLQLRQGPLLPFAPRTNCSSQ
jgi:hypothetical protein